MKGKKHSKHRVVVIGGAGAMGRITVRDLVETAPEDMEIVIADYNQAGAKALAKSYRDQRPVKSAFCDVTDVHETAKLLKGAFAVINSVQHKFNLKVMKAALEAGVHYTDLGGLFHVTRKQLEFDAEFKAQGLLALLGMGAAPGVVNVLARSAADKMDRVHEIQCLVGNIDRTQGRPSTPLGTSYSIETILDEASLPAALYTGGEFTFVEAMSGADEVAFPPPVGVKRPARTLHSEVATLPLSYAGKGIEEVSFRIAFDGDLEDKLRFLRSIGLLSDEKLHLGKAKVAPRDLLLKVLGQIPRPKWEGTPDEYEVVRAVVKGSIDGRQLVETVDCHTPGMPEWGFGVDVDTGCPPSIAIQMLARGEIEARGVLPPERVVPCEPFFRELEKRKMKIERSVIETSEALRLASGG